MIEEISLASIWGMQSICEKCGKEIERCEVRSKSYGRYFGYLCSKCTKEELKDIPKTLKYLKKEYKRYSDMGDEQKKLLFTKIKILNKLS